MTSATMTEDSDTLARTIWGEARGEGNDGMRAVACVVLNRVKLPGWWGHTIHEVCLHPFQFSCWNDDDPNLPLLRAVTTLNPQFASACQIAQLACSGQLTDSTDGATHYFDRRITTPHWAEGKTPCAEIGHHLFFKNV